MADYRVEIGKSGYLFHTDDCVFEQLCHPSSLSGHELKRWARVIEARTAWCNRRNIGYIAAVVPEKHVVYDDMLPEPYKIFEERPIGNVMGFMHPQVADNFIYYAECLKTGRREREVFHKTDIHWTDWGAYRAYEHLLRSINRTLKVPILEGSSIAWQKKRFMGGLVFALDERPFEEVEQASLESGPQTAQLFGSATFKRGQVDVYVNDRTDLPHLVFFRDSNATRMIPFLLHSFSRIVAVATLDFFFDVIEAEKPDVVVTQMAERYLGKLSTCGGIDAFPDDYGSETFESYTGVRLPLVKGDERSVIVFSIHGNSNLFAENGWSVPEEEGRWTIGQEAYLTIPLGSASVYWMLAEISPFVTADHPTQQLLIMDEDEILGDYTLSEVGTVEWFIKGGSRKARLRIVLPDARVPMEALPEHRDPRQLGFHFRRLIYQQRQVIG